jgi:hypothetical protein
MRIVALDVHRSFAQMAILESGKIRNVGKIDLERNRLLQFARKLKPDFFRNEYRHEFILVGRGQPVQRCSQGPCNFIAAES